MKLCRVVFVVAAVFFIQTAFGQAPTEKALLWRISGHGLREPSYLFGTIHLNDKRVFNFDDSVYKAIEETDGLAIEVDPNGIAAYMVNKVVDSMENGRKIKDMLDEKDFNKYSKALSKKLHKPADDITTADIVKEKNKWVSDDLQKGEMPTFVDGYLYSLARKQGKWVGGVEDVADQATLLEDIVDKSDIQTMASDDHDVSGSDNGPDDLIKLYLSQDIEGMSDMSSALSDPAQQDAVITKRNIKMARRMDSLSAIRTMFFAVGSAHLGGEAGVISLLRQRGFTVEPVFCKTKTYSGDYHFTEVPIKWVTVADSSNFYTVQMPGNPTDIKLYGLIDMNFLFDITNFASYATMAIINPGNYSNTDSVFTGVADRMFKSTDAHPYTSIEKNNVTGREYYYEDADGNYRVQLLLKGNMFYMVMMSALKKEALHSPDAEKYFASFKMNDAPVQKEGSFLFSDPVLAMCVETPVKLEENKQMEQEMGGDASSIKQCFTGIDEQNGSYIMLITAQTGPGYSFPNDSTILANVSEKVKLQYSDVKLDTTSIQGYNALNISGTYLQNRDVKARLLTLVRGNKDIILYYIADTGHLHSPKADSMFSSLRLLPYQQSQWSTRTSPDGSFSAWAPSSFSVHIPEKYEFNNKAQFTGYDTATSTTFLVERDTLSKYIWAASDSAFREKEKANNVSDDDTLLLQKYIQNGSYKGVEWFYRNNGARSVKRTRLLRNGNLLYYIHVAGDPAVVSSDDVNKLCNSFSLTTQAAPFDLYSHKTALILHDLASEQDSATRAKALSALKEANFTKEDVPLLQDAVFKKYTSVYQDSVTDMVNQRIADRLNDINDTGTLAYMVAQYPNLTGDKEYLKNTALDYVSYLKTKEGFTALLHLLLNYPVHYLLDDNIARDLKDTPALTYSTLYPQLLQLAADSIAGQMVANVTNELVDSGFLKVTDIQSSEPGFIALSAKLLPALIKDDNADYIYNMHPLLRLLGSFNNPPALKAVTNYLAVKYLYLRKTAILVLADKNQPIDTASLNSVAASPSTALRLYDDLKEIDKQGLFPKKYRTQSNFAASEIYNSNDDDDPVALESLGSKIAECKGKKYKFYLFKVSYANGEDTTSYLGVAGGYDVAGKLLEPGDDEDFTRQYTEEQYDPAAIDEQFEAVIKAVEEE